MPVFISTCRKPRQKTRSVAKLLALLLHSDYENRGKRSVGEVVERSSAAGFKRVAFLHERHGALASIEFYEEGRGWLEEIILVRQAEIPEAGSRVPKELLFEAEDADGKAMAELLQLEQSEVADVAESDCVVARLSSKEFVFFSKGERRLELGAGLRRAGE